MLVLCSLLVTITNPETVWAVEDSWVSKAPMQEARSGLGVAVVDDCLYAIGGVEGWFGTPISAANERYTPADFVPEFPAWTPMLLVITMLAVAVVVYRRRLLKN
jgi:hypothetical protein